VHSRASAEAERLLCSGDALAAAQVATAALLEDPGDHEAHLVCAEALAGLGEKTAARDALLRLGTTLAESGDLFLALASVLRAREYGAKVQNALEGFARAYGAGSDRLEDRRPASPPPVPRDGLPEVTAAEPKVVVEAATRAMMQASDGAALDRELAGDRPLPRAPLFSHLDGDAFVELARALKVRRFLPGQTVIEQGAEGSSFFMVANGEVNVDRILPVTERERAAGETDLAVHLARLGPGSIFGEMAMVSRAPRSATVEAAVPVVLLEADRDSVEMAALAAPQVGDEVVEHCRRRMLGNLLLLSPILRPLDPARRAAVLREFEMQFLERGTVLIHEGELATGLFLLVSGEVEVTRQEGGEPLVLARLGPGDVVGEISLVLRRPATATVAALHATTVFHLPADRFLDLVRDHADLLAELYEMAIRRESETLSIVARESESADGLLI
jgi:CRP-like cAMP-binding protein